MIDLNNPNIPIMSDEGIGKIIKYYDSLYKEGKYNGEIYITNAIKLSTDRNPVEENTDHNIEIMNNNRIEITYSLILAMLQDIRTYGIKGYIDKMNSQASEKFRKYLTPSEITKVALCSKEKIARCIKTNNIEELPETIQYIYNKTADEDHVGPYFELPYVTCKTSKNLKETNIYDFRLYLNNPLGENGLEFYKIFVKKLIKKRVPYDNKFNYNKDSNRKDKSIFYFSMDYLEEVTSALDEMAIEYPELIRKFGTPPTVCATQSYYGICKQPGINRLANNIETKNPLKRSYTYNNYFSQASAFAYFIYYCRQLILHGQIFKMTPEEQKIVKKYSQGVQNKEVCNEIFKTLHRQAIPDEIKTNILKYSNKFNISLAINDYRGILQAVNSVFTYGDIEHINTPICFNQKFYDIETKKAKTL